MSNRNAAGNFEEVPPDPAATIQSLGALGYSPQSAVSDVVDNSISAGASKICVTLHWDGADSWCAIVDNGSGMSEAALKQAMKIGSKDPLVIRESSDLGRFGFGLKTASFSQAKQLTVVTRKSENSPLVARCWDLDHVRRTGRWELGTAIPIESRKIVNEVLESQSRTAVIWSSLRSDLVGEGVEKSNRRAQRHFLATLVAIEKHLAMTFGRFLIDTQKPLEIRVNDQKVRAWDPFLPDNPATQCRPTEMLRLNNLNIEVSPFILPHRSKLTSEEYELAAGPLGWSEQQGFYVYRGDRLIQAGGWLSLKIPRDDSHNLARISIDLPVGMDEQWHLDIRKATVRPPIELADDLKRIAINTRRLASKVYRQRAVHRATPSSELSLDPVWIQERKRGEYSFRINRSHPLVEELYRMTNGGDRSIDGVLRLIELTVPSVKNSDLDHGERQSVNNDGDVTESVTDIAQKIFDTLLLRGMTEQKAKTTLSRIEPFNNYPDVVRKVVGRE